jgi:hypothetical protein
MPERLPHPGASYVPEHEVRLGDRVLSAGMNRPQEGPDDWWLAVLWVTDGEGVVSFRDVAPVAGPPPEPPLHRLGPALAGNLSGLIREVDGRWSMRLVPLYLPEDDTRPWRCPLVVRTAFQFEPALQATLGPDQLADRVLAAFRRAVETLGGH